MQVVTQLLEGAGFDAQVTSHRADGWVVVVAFGVVIARWPESDPIAADTFIAAALLAGWRGKTVATLAFCSEAAVSRVRSRVSETGFAGLAQPARPGRPPGLSPKQLKQAMDLRAAGKSLSEIADVFGVTKTTIVRRLRGVPAGAATVPVQMEISATFDDRVQPRDNDVRDDDASDNDARDDDASDNDARDGDASDDDGSDDDGSDDDGSDDDAPAVVEVVPRSAEARFDEAPRAGDVIPSDGTPRRCRYAGTMLISAALSVLDLPEVLTRAAAVRSEKAVYAAPVVVHALCGAWAAGHPSLESMHEQDPFSLGLILGLARAPSVRTLHRALGQMTAALDPIQLWAGAMVALMRVRPPPVPVFGIDGHFKAYSGDAPIDKGWNSKHRLVERGLATVRVNDLEGHTFSEVMVPAGDSLHGSVLITARALREAQAQVTGASDRPTVLAFDRGGFSFDVLNSLAAEGFWYIAWIPSTVKLPALEQVAPREDGVGEAEWQHPSLTHASRLLATRDGDALLPATSNLPPWIDATNAMTLLRGARGMQENAIKSARAFAHIDRLSDRGVSSIGPDTRPVENPERTRLLKLRKELFDRGYELLAERGLRERRSLREITLDQMVNGLHLTVVGEQLEETPREVARHEVDPEAKRATLKVRHRQLVLPLKNHLENARRWLVAALGASLSPSSHAWDQDARMRTLTALLRSPGTMRFHKDRIDVELDLPLAPTPHLRMSRGLAGLDELGLRASDGRAVRFRLAPRPTREG
jgi:transposase